MWASQYGFLEVVCTLLEGKADVNAKTNVRNQMMIMMMRIEMFVDYDDRRSMYLC